MTVDLKIIALNSEFRVITRNTIYFSINGKAYLIDKYGNIERDDSNDKYESDSDGD